MRGLKYLVVAGALAVTISAANAVTFDWSGFCPACSVQSASGTLDATFEGGDEYLITAITGTTSAGQIVATLALGSFGGNDNLLFFGASVPFDSAGFSHGLSGGGKPSLNINWSCDSGSGICTLSQSNDFSAPVTLSFSIAPSTTPLPATLPLFAAGLGALGLLALRRKRKNAVPLAAA